MTTPLRSVGVTLPDDVMYFASGILQIPGISVNRIIEAGIRAYRGETLDQIRDSVGTHGTYSADDLKRGGKKDARLAIDLVEDLKNKSKAARVGLAMIAYGWSREDAERWADTQIIWGRQPFDKHERQET